MNDAYDFDFHYFVSMNSDNRMNVHTIVPVVFFYYYVKTDCIQHDDCYQVNDNVNVNANVNVNDFHSNSRPNRSDYYDMELLYVWALMVAYAVMTHYIFALFKIKKQKQKLTFKQN